MLCGRCGTALEEFTGEFELGLEVEPVPRSDAVQRPLEFHRERCCDVAATGDNIGDNPDRTTHCGGGFGARNAARVDLLAEQFSGVNSYV